MKRLIFLILFCVVAVPNISSANVRVNEIAWMGTAAGPNEEWIELYNDGSESVDLTGWILTDGVSLSIPLTGSITPGSFAVLERTDDTTVTGTAFLIYTGALGNDGRTLTLTRNDTSVEDQVVGGPNWESIGGNNVTKETAQRTSDGWVTGVGTPGMLNISQHVDTEEMDNTETEETTTATITTSTTHGGSASSRKSTERNAKTIESDPVLELTLTAPRTVYVNQEVEFDVVPSGIGKTLMQSLTYTWNFGDTYTETSKNTVHSFAYPGEYVVVVRATFAKQSALLRHEIIVLPVSLELLHTEAGDIRIKNLSSREIDIGKYTLKGGTTFSFPEFTFIKPQGSLIVNKNRISPVRMSVNLSDALGTEVATTHAPIAPLTSLVLRTAPSVTMVHEVTIEKNDDRSVPDTQAEIAHTPQVQESSSTIIQIGNANTAHAEEGMFRRVFNKIWHIFSS